MSDPRGTVVEAALLDSVDRLSDRVSDLGHAVRRSTRRGIAGLVVLVLLTVAAFGMLMQYRSNAHLARQNHALLTRLEDATTPGGVVYERGRAQTADAVRALLVCGRAYADNATRGTPIPPNCP